MKIRCLSVEVYRQSLYGDCSNDGISSRFNKLLVACPDGPESFESDAETPLNFCMIERRRFSFSPMECLNLVPACVDDLGRIVKRPGWWMYGGNIGATSDSRFSEMNGHYYPLKMRQEIFLTYITAFTPDNAAGSF